MTKSTIALSLLLAVAGTSWASDHSDYAPFATEVKTSTDTEQHYYRIASDRGADNTATYHSPWLSVYSGSSYVSYDTSDDVENQVWSFEAADDNGGVYIKHYQTGKYWNSGTAASNGKSAVQVGEKENATAFYLVDLTKNLIDGFAFTFVDGSFGISSVAGSTTSTFVDAGNRTTETSGTCYGLIYNEWNPWDDARLWGSTDVNANNGSVYYFQEFDIASIEQTKLDDAKSAATSTIDALIANIPGADSALADYKSQIDALTTSDDYTAAIEKATSEAQSIAADLLKGLGGKYVTIQNVRRSGNPYLIPDTGTDGGFITTTETGDNTIWKLIATDTEGAYKVQNVAGDIYIGALADVVPQVSADDAETFTLGIYQNAVTFAPADSSTGLNIDNGSGHLTTWETADGGSTWRLTIADYEEPAAEAAHATISFRGAENGQVKIITYVDITFPEYTEPTGDVETIFTLTDPDGKVVKSVPANGFTIDDNNVWSVSIYPNINAIGTYTATIPEGAFKAGSKTIAADTATVEGIFPTFRVVVTPASGNVEKIDGITIAAPEGAEGEFSFDDWNNTELTITKNGEEVYSCTIDDYYGDYWDAENFKATLTDAKFTDEGRYAMVIPQGSFILYDDNFQPLSINETQVINWVIAGANKDNVTLTTSPAANDTITSTTAINIYEHSDYSFPKADGEGTITITKAGAEEPIASFTAAQVEENHSIDNDDTGEYGWSLPVNITEAGDYTISIPAQFFTYYSDGGDINGYNDAYTATFTVSGIALEAIAPNLALYGSDPILTYLDVKFPETGYNTIVKGYTITKSGAETPIFTATPEDFDYDEEYKSWSSAPFLMGAGEYIIEIPEGAVEYFDNDSTQIGYSSALSGKITLTSDDFTLTLVSPEAGEQSSIEAVQTKYNSKFGWAYGNYYATEPVTITKDNETVASVAAADLANAVDFAYDATSEGYVWTWTLTEAITEAGTYTLTIPAGSITYYNSYKAYYNNDWDIIGENEALTATWTITSDGLRDITVNGEQQDIYDLQGRKVSVARHGQVYIIGGRKVLVK
jgi:hypothetical protein